MIATSESRRRGALLAEAAVAAGILVVVLALTLRLVGGVVAERREASQRQVAAQAASNTMEAVAAMPHAERTTARLGALALDAETLRTLPGGRLRVIVKDADEFPSLQRVVVEVRWPGRSGRPEAAVRLVAWLGGRGGGR